MLFQHWWQRQKMSATPAGSKTLHRRVMPHAQIELLSPQDIQQLDEIAESRSLQYKFSPALEEQFQRFVRHSTRTQRILICLLTAAMFFSVPFWGVQVLGPGISPTLWTQILEMGVVPALFLFTAEIQRRCWMLDGSEWLLLAAFAVEVAIIEYLRYATESAGLPIDAQITLAIPLTVVLMARIRFSRAVLFYAVYMAILIAKSVWMPNHILTRNPSSWLNIGIVLGIVLLAASGFKLSIRRHWASGLLLQVLAYRDHLTGLANRRAFDEHCNTVLQSLARSGHKPVTLAIIDLDYFKRINDTYGHDHGDGTLAEFALLLSQHARRSLDLAARMGGEEFALLLVDCDVAAAKPILDQLVESTRHLQIEARESPFGVMTCSIGAAAVMPDEGLADAYRKADAMLFKAKQEGRNRCYASA